MDQTSASRATRLRLQQFLPVFDRQTQEQLGRLVDVSISGMMLIANRELPIGRNFGIEIRTPAGHPVPPLQLEAESVWCRNNPNNPLHFGVGFRFLGLEGDALAQLEALMHEAGTRH
jgi:hypothetical protein